jgi:hypothetical protein
MTARVIGGSAIWNAREDRTAFAVWVAIIWVGMIAGFGLDFPHFLREQPPPPLIVHVHAVVFVGWLVLLSTQIILVLKSRVALHRRMGLVGAALAVVMTVLGPTTALTVQARIANLPYADPQFLAINLMDILGFAVLASVGIALRHRPAAHKRLMILATVSLADPGFGRLSGALIPEPTTFWAWFAYAFYGNILVITAMTGWDLWRRGRLHPAFIAGAGLLLAGEIYATALYFDPTWKTIAAGLVRAWGYRG